MLLAFVVAPLVFPTRLSSVVTSPSVPYTLIFCCVTQSTFLPSLLVQRILLTELGGLRALADDEVVRLARAGVLEGEDGPVAGVVAVPHAPYRLARLDQRRRLDG